MARDDRSGREAVLSHKVADEAEHQHDPHVKNALTDGVRANRGKRHDHGSKNGHRNRGDLNDLLADTEAGNAIRTLASAKARMMQYTIGPVVGSEKSL